jgi:hypothetical protein
MKKFDLDLTEEEKKAKGYWSWDRFGWKGSGVLRFVISAEGICYHKEWQDSKTVPLEEQAGKIIDALANAEKEANRLLRERLNTKGGRRNGLANRRRVEIIEAFSLRLFLPPLPLRGRKRRRLQKCDPGQRLTGGRERSRA